MARSTFIFIACGTFGQETMAIEASSQSAAYSCAVRHAFMADPYARIGDPVAIVSPGKPLPFVVDCPMIAD